MPISLSRAAAVKITAITVLILLPLVLILATEVAGRVYFHFAHGVPGKTYGIYKAHPKLGAILREDSYNTIKVLNNRGFQGREDVPPGDKAVGELRMVAYGGSTTFCYNLPTGEDWPARLEAQLRERGVNARMLNAGDVSWSLGHINVRTHEEFPGLQADWVVLYSGIDEVTNALLVQGDGIDFTAEVEAGRYGLFSPHLGQDLWLFRNSLLYKMWRFRVVPHLQAPPPRLESERDFDPRLLAAIRANYHHLLRDLIGYWREHGARVLFVIQAVARPDHPNAFRADFSREAAATAAAAGAYVVDAQRAADEYPGDPDDLFIHSGVHWTAAGSTRLAALLARDVPFVAVSRE